MPRVPDLRRVPVLTSLLLLAALGGCDLLGLEPASVLAERRDTEGKAIGAACRHAGRAIEDCYTLNRRADKGAVYTGWRDMNDYMREYKIEAVAPVLQPGVVASAPKSAPEEPEDDAVAAEGAKKHAKAKAQ